MASLAQQRCFNHAMREAAARCPACRRFFCRECVTEHEDRVLCASCLKRSVQTPRERLRLRLTLWLLRPAQVLGSVVFLWLLFYALGRGLFMIPNVFHDDAQFQAAVENQE